jgi:hypothetical protein
MARWAESPCPAREHNEPLLGAVGTSDAGEPAFRIAAVKILLDHLLNDRSEKPILPLETVFTSCSLTAKASANARALAG